MLNKVLLIGRLTRDPEIRYLPSGTQISSFSIAVKRKYKDKDENWQEDVYFFDVETFGALAERIGVQLSKGYQILLEGSLRQDKWEGPAGEKRSKVKIVAEKINLISKPLSSEEGKPVVNELNLNSIDPNEFVIPKDLDDDVPW